MQNWTSYAPVVCFESKAKHVPCLRRQSSKLFHACQKLVRTNQSVRTNFWQAWNKPSSKLYDRSLIVQMLIPGGGGGGVDASPVLSSNLYFLSSFTWETSTNMQEKSSDPSPCRWRRRQLRRMPGKVTLARVRSYTFSTTNCDPSRLQLNCAHDPRLALQLLNSNSGRDVDHRLIRNAQRKTVSWWGWSQMRPEPPTKLV